MSGLGLYWPFPTRSESTATQRRGRADPTMTTPTPPNLARIPAGDFLMGAADAEEDERPVHRVFVSEFLIGRFPVTHDEYPRFVRASGSSVTGHPRSCP